MAHYFRSEVLKALSEDEDNYEKLRNELLAEAIGESRHSRWNKLIEHAVYDGISAYITRLIEDIQKNNLEDGNR